MSDLVTFRASSAPLAMLCPGSARAPDVQIRRHNDAAQGGTDFHERMARVVKNLPIELPADDVDARVLVAHGRACWEGLRESFPNAEAEVALDAVLAGVRITGHLDLLSLELERRRASVGDFKSGRLDSAYAEQLWAYAFLVFQVYPEVDHVTATVIWVREREHETVLITRADSRAWAEVFTARVLEWDGVYRPGTHCLHCPRSHDCPAVVAEGRRDVAIFAGERWMEQQEGDLQRGIDALAPQDLIELVRKARAVKTMADRVIDAARFRVAKDGEQVGDGSALVLAEQERRAVDVGKAWPVLQAQLTDAELAPLLTLALGDAEDVVSKKAINADGAKRGAGKAAREAFGAALQAAGAVSTTTSKVLRERRR